LYREVQQTIRFLICINFLIATGSSLVYSYTALRDIINKNDVTLNPGKKGAVAFQNPELIVTQQLEETNPFKGTHLRQTLTPTDILKFIKLNQKYLVGDKGALEFNPDGDGDADYDGDGKADLPIMKRLAQLDDEFEAEIIEFDDEFKSKGLGSELVFSVIVNKTEKRITVVFRGSVSLKDWIVDLSMVKKTPNVIEEFSSQDVDIHSGFVGECFELLTRGPSPLLSFCIRRLCCACLDFSYSETFHQVICLENRTRRARPSLIRSFTS
jgi:hypothetical protein